MTVNEEDWENLRDQEIDEDEVDGREKNSPQQATPPGVEKVFHDI